MNKTPKITLILFVLFIAMIVVAYNKNNADNVNDAELYMYDGSKNIECLYYNKADFMNVPDFKVHAAGAVRGCVVPHHLVAKNLIHEVFQNVSKNKYTTVVLMGPDHESTDMGKVFTTLRDWQTPTGILETDRDITKELLLADFVKEDHEKLTIEHSTSSIIPFVKHYLGDVKVVTLVLTKQVKLEDAEDLVDILCKSVDMDETLFIASVDFSHYLNLDEANKMDSISMEAIKNEDVKKIMDFTNDNLDSPMSIVTMLKLMGKSESTGMKVLNHSNSELILNKKVEETTSYITYLFY